MTKKTRRQPTLTEFKKFSADVAPAARAVLMARVHAEMERERVATYINPIFASYSFEVSPRFRRDGEPRLITKPSELYLCDDEPMLKCYYADCDDAHRAHGFTGEAGHCPALIAENLVITVEHALMNLAKPLFGIEPCEVFGDDRKKYLELLIGAALKAEKEAA